MRPGVAFTMGSNALRDSLFDAAALGLLREHADLVSPDVLTEVSSAGALKVLSEVDVLVTGWGSPMIDRAVLDAAPNLRLVAHSGGSVRQHIDEVCWERGIAVTTAAQANSIPVAEYSLAFILLAGKKAFAAAEQLKKERFDHPVRTPLPGVGNNGNVVGIIGASRIGRLVLDHLRGFHSEVMLYDPTISDLEAGLLGARSVDLSTLMSESDVISLHAPKLESTIGMIGAGELRRMKDGATFINTSRGALVDHDALRAELVTGRISAVLDVTEPEPLAPTDALYSLPNVIITPHIAGSMGNELPMLGAMAVAEVVRFAEGLPLAHPITRFDLSSMA